MISDGNEEAGAERVETCRLLFRRAAEQMQCRGVPLEDITIGLAYASEDVAVRLKGDHHAAIEWLRTCYDLQERQLLERPAARSH